eukprot:s1204_g9.t1
MFRDTGQPQSKSQEEQTRGLWCGYHENHRRRCGLHLGQRMVRRRAKKYCKGVMDQRTGPVSVTQDDDDDLTMISVPQEDVGFVTGRAGNFLRTIEEEWNTLMFFVKSMVRVDVARTMKNWRSSALYSRWLQGFCMNNAAV